MEALRIRSQVEARLASARMGTIQLAMGSAFSGDTGFSSAPLSNPPIATGMTDSVQKLKKIILQPQPPSQSQYTQVPELLRRIRHLFRAYYNAKLTGRRTSEFKFCDVADIADIGLDLHEIGLTLQFTPARLRALFRYAPDMDTYLLDEPLDVGEFRIKAEALQEAVKADPESDDADRERAMELEDESGNDLAAYHMSYLVGDLLVSWLLIAPIDDIEKRRAERAMVRLVEYSTSSVYRRALGDSLTDAMRPVYWKPKLLLRFAHAGGLPALFDDWVMSMATGICQQAIEQLPSKAWAHQTVTSLEGIMKALIHKTEVDGEQIVSTPLFARFMHEIYSRYGLAPFERGSTLSGDMILFYFLHRRISRKPSAYRSEGSMQRLLEKYAHIPETTRRRHGWMILPISGRWDCLELYGCANPACPEFVELQRLKSRRKRGHRDPVVEDRLFQWGGTSKACTNCRTVSYCSATCQKADWKSHKASCRAKSVQQNGEMEVEI